MSTVPVTGTVTVGPHDFPVGTVPGPYRIALSQPGTSNPPLVQLIPYPAPPAVGAAAPPIAATFNVEPGMYMGDCSLYAADGAIVLWSLPSVPVSVPAPTPDAVTLLVPVSLVFTVGPPAVG